MDEAGKFTAQHTVMVFIIINNLGLINLEIKKLKNKLLKAFNLLGIDVLQLEIHTMTFKCLKLQIKVFL